MTGQIADCPGLWELAVLSLLREAPMHPYEMQRLLRQRHKDEVLALKRGSLYHAIGRLERGGLIEAAGTTREGRRPERTTYRITAAGEEALPRWLRQLIAEPRREPSEFMASLSFLVHLKPADARVQLRQRAAVLGSEVEIFGAAIAAAAPQVGRINLLESEYALALLRAELEWVRGLLTDMESGGLTWDFDTIAAWAAARAREAERKRAEARKVVTP